MYSLSSHKTSDFAIENPYHLIVMNDWQNVSINPFHRETGDNFPLVQFVKSSLNEYGFNLISEKFKVFDRLYGSNRMTNSHKSYLKEQGFKLVETVNNADNDIIKAINSEFRQIQGVEQINKILVLLSGDCDFYHTLMEVHSRGYPVFVFHKSNVSLKYLRDLRQLKITAFNLEHSVYKWKRSLASNVSLQITITRSSSGDRTLTRTVKKLHSESRQTVTENLEHPSKRLRDEIPSRHTLIVEHPLKRLRDDPNSILNQPLKCGRSSSGDRTLSRNVTEFTTSSRQSVIVEHPLNRLRDDQNYILYQPLKCGR